MAEMVSQPSILIRRITRWLSGESLTQRAYLNSFASALDFGAHLVVGFVLNPLLVVGLGNYGYGLWQVLRQLVGYVSPATGRPGQALKWTIANQQASTDFEQKRRLVGSAVAVWFLFLPLLSVLGLALAWFAPIWLDTPVELRWSTRVAAGLLVANMIAVSLVQVPRSVLTGENLAYKRMGLSTLLVFVGGGLIALALYFDTGLIGVAACPLATALLTGALFLRVVPKHVHWFGIARPSFDAVRSFLGLSGWFLAWRLVMQFMRASDVVVLGIFASVEGVTTYTLTKYVPETLVTFVAIVVFGATPGLGGIIGAGETKRATRIRGEIMSLTWLISTVVGATILLWNRTFVELWVGAEYYSGSIPTLMIVLMVTQLALIRNDASIIDLTLQLRNKVLIGALSVTLSVVLAAILVGPWKLGVSGLCLGFIMGRAILSLAYPWLVGHALGVPFADQLRGILRPTVTTALLLAGALDLGSMITVTSWFGLVFATGVTLALAAPVAVLLGLSGTQRKRLLKRVGL
jgi:O-antigen/teichoic acid export membrane protein